MKKENIIEIEEDGQGFITHYDCPREKESFKFETFIENHLISVLLISFIIMISIILYGIKLINNIT